MRQMTQKRSIDFFFAGDLVLIDVTINILGKCIQVYKQKRRSRNFALARVIENTAIQTLIN